MSVYGIDFGTCYSCIAIAEEGKECRIIPTPQGNSTLPSAVEFRLRKNGTPRVGMAAKNAISPLSHNVAVLMKSEMDREESLLQYEVKQGEIRSISPIEFAACIYHELLVNANTQQRNAGGQTTIQAVITVPAVCSEIQREKTKVAAQAAGIEVLKVINEPTAAAISYNISIGETILVFDLGGGTLDVSIVRRKSEKDYQIIASEGDPKLGGRCWDERLIELVYNDPLLQLEFNQEVVTHPRLIEFEHHKICLCSGDEQTINFVDDSGIQRQTTVLLDEFTEFTEDLVERAVEVARKSVASAKLRDPHLHIDRICLAGGACRMQAIENALQQAFPETPVSLVNPDNAIAIGAARYALSLVQNGGSAYDIRLTERGHAYGFKSVTSTGRQMIENFITRTDPLEVQSQIIHRFIAQTGTRHLLTVFENNEESRTFRYHDEKPFFSEELNFDEILPVGTPIDFTFSRDADAIVHISVQVNGKFYNFDFATTAGSINPVVMQRVQHLLELMDTAYEQHPSINNRNMFLHH